MPNTVDTEEFRAMLNDLRARLVGDSKRMKQDADGVNGRAAPMHLADAGTDLHDQEFTLERLGSSSEVLKQVDAALDRLDRGVYGLCDECGEAIPERRLRIRPFAELCIECQRQEETV